MRNGILLKPISVPSDSPPEPIEKSIRDGEGLMINYRTYFILKIISNYSEF